VLSNFLYVYFMVRRVWVQRSAFCAYVWTNKLLLRGWHKLLTINWCWVHWNYETWNWFYLASYSVKYGLLSCILPVNFLKVVALFLCLMSPCEWSTNKFFCIAVDAVQINFRMTFLRFVCLVDLSGGCRRYSFCFSNGCHNHLVSGMQWFQLIVSIVGIDQFWGLRFPLMIVCC
jgi:hypothetical protein